MSRGLFRTFFLAGLISFFLSACNRERHFPEGVVATLSGTPISSEELRETARFVGLEPLASRPLDTWSPVLGSLVFRETVFDRLLEDKAKRDGISVTDEEVAALRTCLSKSGAPSHSNTPFSPPDNLLRRKLLLEKVALEIAPPPSIPLRQVKADYQLEHDRFTAPEKALVKDIVVRSEEEGTAIIAALAAGSSFSALAKAKSLSPEGKVGGLLPPYAMGEMPDPFNRVFSMKPGEVSPLISSPYGYHILKLMAIIPSQQRAFSSVKEEIRRRLIATARRKILDQWLEKELHLHPVIVLPHYRHLLSFQEE